MVKSFVYNRGVYTNYAVHNFTREENCFIKILMQEKGRESKRICTKYRRKQWPVSFVNDLLRKIDKTGSVE